MKYKIGSLVRLKQGDTDTLWLVVGWEDKNLLNIRAVNELDFQSHTVDRSMVEQATVGDETHKKIIETFLLTRLGRSLANSLAR